MDPKWQMTLMVFPQRYDGANLHVHIVVIPSNENPFNAYPTTLPNPAQVPGFAKLQPEFKLAWVNGTDDFPLDNATAPGRIPVLVDPQGLVPAANKADLLKAVEEQMPAPVTDTGDKPPKPMAYSDMGNSVRKYLPKSYRGSFNFTGPRHPNAVTDDSYHCAIRDEVKFDAYNPRTTLSWGRVFAHILRQPLLAEACGFIYKATVPVPANIIANGGYLYAEIVNEPWQTAQNQLKKLPIGALIKRYAAKIPVLDGSGPRPVFAPVLFPVLHKIQNQPEPEPKGPWDELFLEAANYDDGFASIVHANQPVSGNLLAEQRDGLQPQKDAGIRIGWDDEQILIWYVRQLVENSADQGSGKVIDAPLGVLGYAIDVREQAPNANWESLHTINISNNLDDGTAKLTQDFSSQQTELPYQVYPNKIKVKNGSSRYWLPLYYAKWIGRSLAVNDDDALAIYKNDQPNSPSVNTAPDRTAKPNNSLVAAALNTQLKYGHTYQFRVRLKDISGGGPDVNDQPLNPAPSPSTSVSFKRYVAPDKLRIAKPSGILENKFEYFNALDADNTDFDNNPVLKINRPLLEYPAVVFTNRYQQAGQDPIALLKALALNADNTLLPALADPDVKKIEIKVEVESLRMDNSLSESGRENYIPLFITHRKFDENDWDATLEIPVQFLDVPVLNLDYPKNLTNPFLIDNLKAEDINGMDALPLPTGRTIRVTIRGVAEATDHSDETYFGFIDDDRSADSRYGKATQLKFYKQPQAELDLLVQYQNIPVLQGIYLKPDEVELNRRDFANSFLRREAISGSPDVVSRLAKELGLTAKGLTLYAPKGERIAFGCSSRIRHNLAPDGSSITFASKAELENHWLACLSYDIQRDWAWDTLQDNAFVISRRMKFRKDAESEWVEQERLGDIEVKHTVSFEALQPDRFGLIQRNHTRIVYIDALEPGSGRKIGTTNTLRHPDELWAEYTVTAVHKDNHAKAAAMETERLKLPTVIKPSQVPAIASVGIAFSPYDRAEDYSSTEARRRYLWVEFKQPVANPDDLVFCRVLANAPDQLLSNNETSILLDTPVEPPLVIDPEEIRVIIPGQSDDKAGIGAMQPMTKSTDSDLHYLLPLPVGMHSESAELFGFFTYEFRIGHGHWPDREDNLWSTAQGRYGRPLRVTGMQHPCPTLFANVNRDEKNLYVSAPYAKAVFKGRNVTAKPPRTSLWAMLYAQVKQADGKDYRNILIGEKYMQQALHLFFDTKRKMEETEILLKSFASPKKPLFEQGAIKLNKNLIEMGGKIAVKKDIHPTATASFSSAEIAARLKMFGLPEDSPLSVLVVEVFGNITNMREHFNFPRAAGTVDSTNERIHSINDNAIDFGKPRFDSLNNALGQFRILRTSPLTKTPFVCCPTCDK